MSSLLAVLLVIFVVAAPINGLDNPRKLQEVSIPVSGSPNTEVKCGGCPVCNTPCTQTPSPPPPSPPPPSPPPSPKKPPTPSLTNCPPPPSYIYITGPPGNLYPVDPYFSGGMSLVVGLPLLVGCGILSVLAFL